MSLSQNYIDKELPGYTLEENDELGVELDKELPGYTLEEDELGVELDKELPGYNHEEDDELDVELYKELPLRLVPLSLLCLYEPKWRVYLYEKNIL